MKRIEAKNDDVKDAIINLLTDKLPNSIRIRKVRETLERNEKLKPSHEEIDNALNELVSEKIIKVSDRDNPALGENVRRELKRRETIELANPPESPIRGVYTIKETEVVRLLNGDKVSAEDINEVTEALKEYIERIDKTFDERVQKKTAEIYKQMIGIFGVFVSIFSIIIISTDKMLRFDPGSLTQDWITLLFKSSALFLPVGVVIGGLVWIVLRGIKK
jgi:hypothetical protein